MCYIEKFQYNNILAWKLKHSYNINIYIYIYTKKDDHKSNTPLTCGPKLLLNKWEPNK